MLQIITAQKEISIKPAAPKPAALSPELLSALPQPLIL